MRAGCGLVVSISDSAKPVSISSFPPAVSDRLQRLPGPVTREDSDDGQARTPPAVPGGGEGE